MIEIRFEERDGAGHIVNIAPRAERLEFRPMNLTAFRSFYLENDALTFSLENARASISGPEHNDDDFTGGITFSLPRKGSGIEFAALVPGGWLPANVAQVEVFLPDSNIACNLGAFKAALGAPRASVCDSLHMGAKLLNPMLPAIEGSKGRFPTLAEVEARALEVHRKFERRFPGRALPLTPGQVLAAYQVVDEHIARWPREREFLAAIWPEFARMRTREADPERALRLVQAERDRNGMPRLSFLYLLALNAMFGPRQRPKHWCPGEAVLKPHQPPTDANLYNVCSDVWLLELAMKAYSLFGEGKAAICTQDRGLIGAWAMLAPRSFQSEPGLQGLHTLRCSVSLPDDLVERMPVDLRDALWRDLRAD